MQWKLGVEHVLSKKNICKTLIHIYRKYYHITAFYAYSRIAIASWPVGVCLDFDFLLAVYFAHTSKCLIDKMNKTRKRPVSPTPSHCSEYYSTVVFSTFKCSNVYRLANAIRFFLTRILVCNVHVNCAYWQQYWKSIKI